MKTKILFTALLLMIFHFISNAQGTWTQKTNFGGVERWVAVGFSIGDKGYIGTGSSLDHSIYYRDFWEYDPVTNAWTQKADFGGVARDRAVGFSIGKKGYIGTGINPGNSYLKDFWEYNPATNTWTQKGDFGGNGRYGSFAFVIGNKGYVGTGAIAAYTFSKDFWEYDPATDTWTRKKDFGGIARQYATAFAIKGKGYAGTGYTGARLSDFWEYDPMTDTWKQKADYGGGGRNGAVAFSLNDKGYIGTGEYQSYYPVNDFWEYDPASNTWTSKADVDKKHRTFAVGFVVGNNGYIGTGAGDSYLTIFKDFWEYTPGETTCAAPSALQIINTTDSSAKLGWTIPNTSVKGFCIIYRAVNTSKWTERTRKPTDDRIVLKGLSPSTAYQWKMRSICKDGYSKWVTGPGFTTASSFASTTEFSDASIAGKFGVYISPNPVTNSLLNLRITNAGATTANVSLIDMQGKTFITQNLLLNSAALNKAIDVSALPKGVYILKVINNKNEQQQIKFVKAN